MKKSSYHTAAAGLSLLGWYLMEPPLVCNYPTIAQGNTLVISQSCDATRPLLSEWLQVDGTGGYDLIADCEAAKKDYQSGQVLDLTGAVMVDMPPGPNRPPPSPEEREKEAAKDRVDVEARQAAIPYRCVASDDPRLAK